MVVVPCLPRRRESASREIREDKRQDADKNATSEDGHSLPPWKDGGGGHHWLLQKKGEENIKEKHESVAGHPSPL